MLMTTDTRLVTRAARGDQDAFEAVFAASFPCVHAFCARRTQTRAAAEALTERVLGRAFAALDAYAGDVPFAAWLLALAKQVEAEERMRRRPIPARARLPVAHTAPR